MLLPVWVVSYCINSQNQVLIKFSFTHNKTIREKFKIYFQVKYFQNWRFLQRSHLKKIPFPLLINYTESKNEEKPQLFNNGRNI